MCPLSPKLLQAIRSETLIYKLHSSLAEGIVLISLQCCNGIALSNETAVPTAFLPMKTRQCPNITIALDLDETLISSSMRSMSQRHRSDYELNIRLNEMESTKVFISLRPYLVDFLREISAYMEVVVFTASHKEYADKVIDLFDPSRQFIRHRLYREHCSLSNGIYLKELKNLNRDMSRCILVDNSPLSILCNVENGILIKNYEGDLSDNGLVYLLLALRHICTHDDLREGIKRVINN